MISPLMALLIFGFTAIAKINNWSYVILFFRVCDPFSFFINSISCATCELTCTTLWVLVINNHTEFVNVIISTIFNLKYSELA